MKMTFLQSCSRAQVDVPSSCASPLVFQDLVDEVGMQSLHWAGCHTVEWANPFWQRTDMQILSVRSHRDEWLSITQLECEACVKYNKDFGIKKYPSLYHTRPRAHTHILTEQ